MAQTANAALGTRIRLISNSDIRYEGYLHCINSDDNTVSLKNVHIFGTEGRKGGFNEVPPSDQLFEVIVFRGDDIKDLTLYEQPNASSAVDPAILSATPARGGAAAPPVSASAQTAPPASTSSKTFATALRARNFYDDMFNGQSSSAGGGAPRRGSGFTGNNTGGRYSGGSTGGGNNFRRGGYNVGRGSGGHYRRRHAEGHTGQDFHPATGNRKEEFKEDFDFEKSREEFEKNKIEFEKAKEDARTHVKAYSKQNCFFDTVSCDPKERNQGRMDREEMKKADTETFGSEMVGSMRGFRRGRGGRGRYNRY